MAYDPLADGEEYTAAWSLANVSDQVVSQVTSATPPPGTSMQVIGETDTGKFKAHNGTAFVEFGRVSGQTTYTPQVDQGATSNIAKTVNSAYYVRIGNLIHVWVTLTMTASGTAGSSLTVSLPVAPSGVTAGDSIGSGHVNDASAAGNSGPVDVWFSSGSVVTFRYTGVLGGNWGVAPNAQIVSGDTIRFHAMYLCA